MLIQNCFKGQRVIYKENGRPATVLSVSHNKGEITIAFDNAERRTVSAALLEPATETTTAADSARQPLRPCPNCAAKMPLDVTTCPQCGFQYGVKKRSAVAKWFKTVVVLAVLAAVAYAIWKFVLTR